MRRSMSEATKAKIRAAQIGHRHSVESRAKMSASRMGVKKSPEAIEKTAAAHRGRKRSPEACARIREGQRRARAGLPTGPGSLTLDQQRDLERACGAYKLERASAVVPCACGSTDLVRNSKKLSGYGTICKACHAAETRTPAARVGNRVATRKYTHGLLDSEYRLLRKSQKDRCAICEIRLQYRVRTKSAGQIDHDHTTGRVRGILCTKCNLALGLIDDDPVRARAMAVYIEKHSVPHSRDCVCIGCMTVRRKCARAMRTRAKSKPKEK